MVAASLLAACASPKARGAPGVASAPGPTAVTAKNSGGSAGVGPLIVEAPRTQPGGHAAPEVVRLRGRSLTVNGVARSAVPGQAATLVGLDITIQNEGTGAVRNDATFFTLISPEGDTFAQERASNGFYGEVPAGTERRGTVVFRIPAMSSGLRLLYRPDVPTDAVLMQLPAATTLSTAPGST
jgi:hypothetical protein